jgi:hypothetical protein
MQREVHPISNKSKMQLAFREKLHLAVLLLVLFVFALCVPAVSFSVLLAAFFVLSVPFILNVVLSKSSTKKSLLTVKFILAFITLLGFSVTYFMTVFGYNFIDETTAIRAIVLVNISYIIGYSINFEAVPDKTFNYIYVCLALIGGGVLFVYLSVGNSSTVDIIGRSAPNFWKPGEDPINGPVLDLYSMLGTGIVPIILYGKNQQFNSRRYQIVAIIACLIGVVSMYMSILLQGRKAILSLFVVLLLTTLFKLKSIEKKDTRNLYIFLILFISLVVIIASDSIVSFVIGNFEVFSRFQSEGLESGRYQAWMDIFEAMPKHLMGGRTFVISASYAHNIWLDTFYDGGFLPMTLLVFFHALHVQPMLKILSSRLPETIIILMICVIVPILIGFQGEPVIQASIFYFSTSCCFLGLIMRLSQVADQYNAKTHTDIQKS